MNTAVVGIGNILLRDEGVGVYVINMMRKNYTFTPDIDLIDGGTKGLDLIPFLEDKERLIFVDAVDFKKEPGYIGILENNDIPSVMHSKLSVHHIGLGEVILALNMLESKPPEMVLVGVQPLSIDTGLELSDIIKEKVGIVIENVLERLRMWGIRVFKKEMMERI